MSRSVLTLIPGILAILVTSSVWGRASAHSISFTTEDGVTLAATYYEPSRHPAPGIVFIHMLSRNREDWRPVASRLADAGFAAVAFDLRGHGGSTEGPLAADGRADLSRMVLDVRAVLQFLSSRPEVTRVFGLCGASVGGNIAVLSAAGDPSVKSIALLSPGLDYQGLRIETAMRKYGDRAALLVAGANDPYALRSVRQLATLGAGLRDVRTVEAGGHGSVMLSRSPDVVAQLVDWFQRTLL